MGISLEMRVSRLAGPLEGFEHNPSFECPAASVLIRS